mmetsp:Transcript_13311/g.25014  ORF Transcript_13311/g.25014 Transcript_13311/m.25014 type:complete len:288 (+) Transcript_13311:857-1720(+)
MRSHAPIRPTCEFSLTREELPIEEDIDIPSERPTAPFKTHEYSVISSQPSTAETKVSNIQESLNLLLKEEFNRKQTQLDDIKRQMADLEAKVYERRRPIATFGDNISLLVKDMPAEVETSRSEISAYESAIESLTRSIGSQSRRLKEYEGHIARRHLQVSESKLRLDDLRLDTSRNSSKRKELYRMVFSYRRLLTQPSSSWLFTASALALESSLKLSEIRGQFSATQQSEACSTMYSLKEELTRSNFIASHIRTLRAQIKAKMSQMTEMEKERLELDIAAQARLLLN